jgi:GSCFA family
MGTHPIRIVGANVGRFDHLDADHERNDEYNRDDPVAERVGGGFFRGAHCTFAPHRGDFDRDGFVIDFVLKGWAPKRPLIAKTTKVTAFGSCFAQHLAEHLGSLGYNLSKDRAPMIHVSRMSEGMVNTYAILQQFEWALENIKPPENLWHGYRCEQFGYDEEVRKITRQVFLETEIFVITLGLSEIWYDEITEGVFWRAVPMNCYDPSRHKFRVSSFEETKNNIQRIYELIRKHVPCAKIVFTLSPIPLAATFRPVSVITANSASKAILRAALDEFYRDHATDVNDVLFYFPSFEIVNDLFQDKFQADFRHPHLHISAFVTKLFEALYCEGGPTITEVDGLLRQALRDEITMSVRVPRTLKNLICLLRGWTIEARRR